MKLERKKPDRQGYWWCWKEEMDKPVVYFIWLSSGKWMVKFTRIVNNACYPVIGKTTGFTHFAGPIKGPEVPEPSRVWLSGMITGQPICLVGMGCFPP